MRMLHIVGDSKFGGASIVILRLAELAVRLGWQVDVLTTDPAFQDVLRKSGVGVVDLEVIWRDTRPLRDLLGIYRLYRFLLRNHYTLVHTHTSKAGFVGRLAASLARIPLVVHTVHGFAFHEESHLLALRFYVLLERITAHWCHRIVTVSEFHRRWALQLGIGNKQKVIAIPNGIPEDRVIPSVEPQNIRQSWGSSTNELVILSTGRLAPQKGLEYLITAVPMLADQLTRPLKVVLAGDGPLKPELERMVSNLGVQNTVLFLGFCKDIGSLLAASDLVVLPSLWEGLSITLLEAMAAAKPIITTAIGSNREATRDGEAAILVPPKDPKALAIAIAQLAENPSLAVAKAKRAREICRTYYTEDRMIQGYSRVYAKLLEASGVKYG